jgi:hypothetical protein
MYMRALAASQNAASVFRSRETLSAPDLRPHSNSAAKKRNSAAKILAFLRLSGFLYDALGAMLRGNIQQEVCHEGRRQSHRVSQRGA